jgi:hypothetical protein
VENVDDRQKFDEKIVRVVREKRISESLSFKSIEISPILSQASKLDLVHDSRSRLSDSFNIEKGDGR